MTSDQVAAEAVANGSASPKKRRLSGKWIALIVGVIVVDALAFIAVPPKDKTDPTAPCA